uniref:tail fiber assembly protein n=1 Tax=Escherichia coli TaxID=562 RepID=UPI003F75A2D7
MREYISASTEYLLLALVFHILVDAPASHKQAGDCNGAEDFLLGMCQIIWQTVYSIDTELPEITVLGDYPENTTTIAPLTLYDKWDGEKWWLILRLNICNRRTAETKRQSLIDTAMDSIGLIQLKLRAGRKLTQAETAQLNSVLDYGTS